jgi:phosphoketolase
MGFKNVILVDAKDFDDANQPGAYVDSTAFSFQQRLAFTQAVLAATDQAAKAALGGTLTVLIIKQLKGAGVHKRGAKSHNLYPGDSLDKDYIVAALKARALTPAAWDLVRTNFERSMGGPNAQTAVTESVLPVPDLGLCPWSNFRSGAISRWPPRPWGLSSATWVSRILGLWSPMPMAMPPLALTTSTKR